MTIQIVSLILLGFMIACAICASLSKSMFNTVLIFMGFSVIMSVIWLILQAPDLSITEAAVGVGVDTVLYFLTLKKLNALKGGKEQNDTEKS